MKHVHRSLGLMTGTSVDGIDAAIIETDGEGILDFGPTLGHPFGAELRSLLKDVLKDAQSLKKSDEYTERMRNAERILTLAHGDVVLELLARNRLSRQDIDVIGFHGQTIVHRPGDSAKPESLAQAFTRQIGNGELLAQLTGISVVNDFRSADVEAGGQGAPFAPVYHRALVNRNRPCAEPVCVVNIGGVSNVTFVPAASDGVLLAFDTGPGNGLIDDWMQLQSGRPYDEGGEIAKSGRVHEDVLSQMLAHPYFDMPAPKSLDRYDFDLSQVKGLSLADGAATLTAFTAAAIGRALENFPTAPARWIICGGGRHNRTLMTALENRLGSQIVSAEDMGWDGDALEAQAFAYLAVRSLKGLPLSYPGTTGVPEPMTGGRLWLAPDF